MPLLTLNDVCLAYGDGALLDHADLIVESGERIGIVGRNGAGKSSLFKVIAGVVNADDGVVWRQPRLKVELVSQEPALNMGATVFDTVSEGLDHHAELIRGFHRLTRQLDGAEEDNADLLDRLQHLQGEIERVDGWTMQSRVQATIDRLNLDADASVDALSGGMKKRVFLARALVAEPELLLLDEPTNHLDIEGIEWLEGFLQAFSGSVLVISHDRSFLDRISTRIVELDRGVLRSFPGSYAAYIERKQQLLDAEAQQQARFDKLLAQEEVWIRKGIEARRTRNEGRVRRLERLRRERSARRERVGLVNIQLGSAERSGQLVAELIGVSKQYGARRVIDNFSCTVQRGDKVGLIGPNGCGKTTLLRLLLGELEPDSGQVRRGTRLTVAYYDQFRAQLNAQATLAETISPGQDSIEIAGVRKHVISYLGDFLFSPERARARVSSLSGGERNRLLLARLFAQPANTLVLDEPTNDLDIETLELLESLLQDYSGTLLVVSHDRTFLDNVVTQTIAFEGDGKLVEYAGGYEDVVRARRFGAEQLESSVARTSVKAQPPTPVVRRQVRGAALNYKESRELEGLPDLIAALEHKQAHLTAELARPELYREQPGQVGPLRLELKRVEADIECQMARWEELETRKSGAAH